MQYTVRATHGTITAFTNREAGSADAALASARGAVLRPIRKKYPTVPQAEVTFTVTEVQEAEQSPEE